MIVPSIDLQNGNAVQLVGGKELAIDAGDPRPIADRFGRVGEVAVIDLDAALGTGSNASVIQELLTRARCRVGGGIRDAESAVRWLDAGASKVILGTAARPEVLKELPRERVIAALDATHGEVVTEGWTKRTGQRVEDRIEELKPYVGGFLVTFVEREGRMTGMPMDRVAALRECAGGRELTVAGGVAVASDIAAIDAAGCETQVGMALYSGVFDLAEGFVAPLKSDRADGLWPTVVCDERGVCLGLVYSNLESVRASVESGKGVYHSRSRGGLWEKGKTSGATQELLRIDADCDRDALRFTVRQHGDGFCHTGTRTCFGSASGLSLLEQTLVGRRGTAVEGSYSARLFSDAALLRSKLVEEAVELADAGSRDEVMWEAADVMFFAMARAIGAGVSLAEIEGELDRRALGVTRRPGNAKPADAEAGEMAPGEVRS